jgi:hypothetical protein
MQTPNTTFQQNMLSNFKDEKRMDKDFLHFKQTIQTKNAPYLQVASSTSLMGRDTQGKCQK